MLYHNAVMLKNPDILQRRMLSPEEVAERGFRIEELHLRFSNGAERHFRRIPVFSRPAVLIVPMLDLETVLLIREYSAGLHQYQLQLPKGGIDANETVLQAANRELQEEVGKAAKQLRHINTFSVLPGFMAQSTNIVLAQDLYDQRLPGDEPEPLEVVPWPMHKLMDLAQREDCTEARSLAALYFVRDYLAQGSYTK